MSPAPETQRPAARPDVVPGELLGGKFRVERVVGRGGMGIVIEATNVQLDQRVALKLLATGGDDPAVVERFSREARAAARLRSEHVARVYDVGRDPVHGPFIVMELLEGKTLAEVLSSTGRVALHRAIEYIIDACEGLAEAHARGIVHQDVKPANLFLVTGADGRPTIKLLDFGIATMRSSTTLADPKSSHPSVGTPAYLAPEQLRAAGDVDHRADVWALGCVLYELLAGARAFRATRFTELVTTILEEPPHELPEDLALPVPIEDAIQRCLEKVPERRFASTGELALALLPFARRRAHSAVARAVAQVKAAGLDPELQMPSSMPPPPVDSATDIDASVALRPPAVPSFAAPEVAQPRGRGGVLVGVALLFAVAVTAYVVLRTPPRPAEPTAVGGTALPTPSTSAAVSAEPAPPPSATVSAPPSAPPSSEAAPPPASAVAPVVAPRAWPAVPRPRPAPPVTSAAGADSEIRRNR